MIFEVYNTKTRVASITASEDAWLREILSHTRSVRGYGGATKGYQQLCMYDPVERTFPSGLLPIVTDMAREKDLEVLFIDKRVKPCLPKEVKIPFLEDPIRGRFQKEAIEAGVTWGRGIWWCPTAFGKTNLAVGIGKRIPCKWAFLVDETSLLDQTIDRWNAWDLDNEPAGILGAGRWEDARFVVATYQTIMARQNEPVVQRWIESIGGLLMDEVHVVAAPRYYETSMLFANAYYRLGMSATPLSRGAWENLHVYAATGRVIYRATIPEMVDAGVLSMPEVDMIETPGTKESFAATWQGVYGELIVRNTQRNNEVIARAVKAEKPCIIFVKQVSHGEDLLQRAKKQGLKVELLYGEDSIKARRLAIAKLQSGELDTLITNKIFQKGVDIPKLMSVIIAAGGASVVDSLQRVGRGMRLAPGKKLFTVIDFMDRGHPWLLRHSRERKKAYKDAGYLFADKGNQPTLFTTPPK
mgnify:CR=1 FL=1